MRIAVIALLFLLFNALPSYAKCSKEEICEMIKKMDHFSILGACPGAGPLLAECKKVSDVKAEDLPEPNFIDNGDNTVTDTNNKLLWLKKGILKKVSLKNAKSEARESNAGGKTGWRLPTLSELRSLMYKERVINASGKKAWIYPVFDDGLGHYYWTSTTCDQISVTEDRYQTKICQQGDQAAWLVHFNINAVFWHHTSDESYHVWLVKDLP